MMYPRIKYMMPSEKTICFFTIMSPHTDPKNPVISPMNGPNKEAHTQITVSKYTSLICSVQIDESKRLLIIIIITLITSAIIPDISSLYLSVLFTCLSNLDFKITLSKCCLYFLRLRRCCPCIVSECHSIHARKKRINRRVLISVNNDIRKSRHFYDSIVKHERIFDLYIVLFYFY